VGWESGFRRGSGCVGEPPAFQSGNRRMGRGLRTSGGAAELVPKFQAARLLAEGSSGSKVWRKRCIGLAQWGRERKAAMDVHTMKVTPRDQQVLDLLIQGCSNNEIAGQLSISPRTVKQHLRTLFLRAGIRDGRKRVKLAIAAFEKEGARL